MKTAVDSPALDVAERVRALESVAAPRPALLVPVTRFLADAVAALAILAASHALLAKLGVAPLRLDVAVAFAGLLCGALVALDSYRALEGPSHVEAVAAVIEASGFALIGVLAIGSLLGSTPPALALALDAPAAVLGLVTLRVFAGPVQHRLTARGFAPVVVYGAGATGRLLAQHLLHETGLGLRPVGFIDDDERLAGTAVRAGEGERGERLPVLGTGASLGRILDETRAAAVFIAIPSLAAERITAIADGVEARRRPVYFVPSSGSRPFASLRLTSVDGIPLLARRRPRALALYAIAKRALDVAASALLLALAAPFLAAAVVLVRLTSPGPAIFTQERIGQGGRRFRILKLRTMYRDADPYAFHPERAGDGRVTPVGRWLRRTSLDELPQLWNILRGDMSFVGPRPEMPFIVAGYGETELQRLLVKPGLTGLWQVSPDRAFRIHENLHHDLYYLEHRSLALDLAILVLTPLLLVSQRAAR